MIKEILFLFIMLLTTIDDKGNFIFIYYATYNYIW